VYGKRHHLECGDLSPLCVTRMSESGDKSPHSKDAISLFRTPIGISILAKMVYAWCDAC